LIDFNEKKLIDDAVFVGLASKGSISLDNMKEFPFPVYKYLMETVRGVLSKLGIIKEK